MTYLTWRGLDVNGVTCVLLAGFGLLPFAVFCVAGLPEVQFFHLFEGRRTVAIYVHQKLCKKSKLSHFVAYPFFFCPFHPFTLF